MKTLLLVLCLALPAISFASLRPLAPPFGCTVDTLPNEQGKCQFLLDPEGTVWLIFWDNTKKIRFIRTKKDGEYIYMYQRKLGIPV